jgi:dolichol-phosphate mannosyltransferase
MNDNKALPVAVVIIPTYNEANNIAILIDELFEKSLPNIQKWQVKVLIVDANSPDGTSATVNEKIRNNPNLYIHVEKDKQGLGAAYIKGFDIAIKDLSADVVIEFDADFQHPPRYIELLLNEIENGYDYVLGSRKIEGGAETYNRNIFRSFLTSFGSVFARFILFFPMKNFFLVTDATTGLKATRVSGILDKLDLDPNHLYSKKFGYKIQLLSETLEIGAKYKEIPLRFDDRRADISKFESTTTLEILVACIKTRLHNKDTVRFMKFAVVGFTGYIINAISLEYMQGVTNIEALSWTISTELAILSNFTFNNLWTFRSHTRDYVSSVFGRLIKFNSSSIGALIIQVVVGTLGVYLLGDQFRQIILIFTSFLIVPFYNWYMYNNHIWTTNKKPS